MRTPHVPIAAPDGNKQLLSGVRILGCLTIFVAFAIAILGFATIGPLALIVAGGVALVGILMARVTKVS